jgi:hypothetical protein
MAARSAARDLAESRRPDAAPPTQDEAGPSAGPADHVEPAELAEAVQAEVREAGAEAPEGEAAAAGVTSQAGSVEASATGGTAAQSGPAGRAAARQRSTESPSAEGLAGTGGSEPALPAVAAQLLELFRGPLEGVHFPDVDAARLEALAADVRSRAAEVERVRAELARVEAVLTEGQDELARVAHRGLAYARIYAQGNAELSARLDEIERAAEVRSRTAAAASAPAPRKRGRKPKARDSATEGLPFDAAGER